MPLEFTGSKLPKDAKCISCGATIHLVAPLGNIVTGILIERARRELSNHDVTMAILLSAMAMESEMAYLFFKWRTVDSVWSVPERTRGNREQWENEWAEIRSITKRLDELSRLLTKMCFDHFAQQNKELLMPTLDRFVPSASIRDYFQDEFFEKRNRIAHYGEIDLPFRGVSGPRKNGSRRANANRYRRAGRQECGSRWLW